MSQSDKPTITDTTDSYDLDQLPFDDEREEDDEEGSGSSSGDGKSPKKKYRIIVEPFLDFADDPELSPEENTERKLRLLAISPMSILVPGASSFASENDLSRRIFMADVGQFNREIAANDIADPDLIKKLDERQRERRTLMGLPHPALVLSGSMALASAMVGLFAGIAAKVTGKDGDPSSKKKSEVKSKKDKLKAFSSDKESAFGGLKDKAYDGLSDKELSIPGHEGAQSDAALGEILDHVTVTTVTEQIEVTRTALDFDSLSSFFNFLSEIVKAPVLKVALKDKAGGGSKQVDAPSVPWQDFTPNK